MYKSLAQSFFDRTAWGRESCPFVVKVDKERTSLIYKSYPIAHITDRAFTVLNAVNLAPDRDELIEALILELNARRLTGDVRIVYAKYEHVPAQLNFLVETDPCGAVSLRQYENIVIPLYEGLTVGWEVFL